MMNKGTPGKFTVGAAALTLMLFAGCRSKENAKGLPALREIKVERGTMLMLGGKMPSASDFCSWSGATCTLRPGTFGGTEAMSLTKTESGLIGQFQFDYGVMSADAVEAQVDEYTHLLGKPSRDSASAVGGLDERDLEWSDSATTFALTYKTDQKQTKASATLSDNGLAAHVH
jgi:hypothetical protein